MSKRKQIEELQAQRDEIQRQLDEANAQSDSSIEPSDEVNEAAARLAHAVGVQVGIVGEEAAGAGWEVRPGNDEPCPIITIPEELQRILNIPRPVRENGGVVILVGHVPTP